LIDNDLKTSSELYEVSRGSTEKCLGEAFGWNWIVSKQEDEMKVMRGM